jgi:chemotaxis protein methyltransferase CheR
VLEKTGLYYPPEKRRDLEKGLAAAATEKYSGNTRQFITSLTEQTLTTEQYQLLVKHLTIGETYFFREPGTLNLLISRLKPEIDKRRKTDRTFKLWSAGCCSGEELYSMAILLSQTVPDIANWKISLIGTDINDEFISRAKEGIYQDWSFRGVQPEIQNNYFNRLENGSFQIQEQMRNLTNFFYLNLFENSYPSPINGISNLDTIICRNVLMYFNDEGRRHILERFSSSLKDGGFLVVSLTELSYIPPDLFDQINENNVFLYRKRPAEHRRKTGTQAIDKKSPKKIPDLVNHSPSPNTGTDISDAPTIVNAKIYSISKFTSQLQRAIEAKENAFPETSLQLLKELLENSILWNSGSDEEKESTYYHLATLLFASGRLQEARKLLERAITEIKLSSTLYFTYANVLSALGLYEKALNTLKKCIYLDHESIAAHYFAALTCKKLQRQSEYKRYLKVTAKLLSPINNETPVSGIPGSSAGELKKTIIAFLGSSNE